MDVSLESKASFAVCAIRDIHKDSNCLSDKEEGSIVQGDPVSHLTLLKSWLKF